MNCEKAKAFFPLLNSTPSQDPAHQEVASHVSTCESCSVALEKTRKLQQLLALKKHEQPDEFFMRTYVSEFHRKLYADVVKNQSRSIWSRIREAFTVDVEWTSVAQSMAAVVILGVIGYHFSPFSTSSRTANHRTNSRVSSSEVVEVESRYNELVAAKSADKSAVYVLDRVSYKPANNGPVVLQF